MADRSVTAEKKVITDLVQLPKDIFLQIISKLSLRDKVEYTRVNKEWCNAVRNGLCDSLDFINTEPAGVDRALTHLILLPFDCKQVLYMWIQNCDLSYRQYERMSTMFSNMSHLTWLVGQRVEAEGQNVKERNQHQKTEITKIKESYKKFFFAKLESLTACAVWLYELNFFAAHQYFKLTTLHILFDTCAENKKQGTLRLLYHSFKNLPALDTLALYEASVSINDINAIHTAAPKLKSLTLADVHLRLNEAYNGTITTAISSMKSLQIFQIRDSRIGSTQQGASINDWIKFFGTKYPFLQIFYILTPKPAWLSSAAVLSQLQIATASTLSKMKNLEYYENPLCPWSSNMLKELEYNRTHLKNWYVYVDKNDIDDQLSAFRNSNITNRASTLTVTIKATLLSDEKLVDFLNKVLDIISEFEKIQKLRIIGHPKLALTNLNFISQLIRLHQHHVLKELVIDECTFNNKAVYFSLSTMVVKPWYYYISLQVECFGLADHPQANQVLEVLLSYPYFAEIRVKGDILCGCGKIAVPFYAHSRLSLVKVDLSEIGKCRVYGDPYKDDKLRLSLWYPNSKNKMPEGVIEYNSKCAINWSVEATHSQIHLSKHTDADISMELSRPDLSRTEINPQ